MRYNIQVDVNLEKLESKIGPVYDMEAAVKMLVNNNVLGIAVVSIEEVKQ